MKKKYPYLILSCLLLTAGCEEKKGSLPIEDTEVKAEVKMTRYDLSYDLDVKTEKNEVKVELSIDNQLEKDIPLLTNKEQELFVVRLKQEGKVIKEDYILAGDRDVVLKNEKVAWSRGYKWNLEGDILVESELLLKSNKEHKYEVESKKKKKMVEFNDIIPETEIISFAPNEYKVYTYKNAAGDKIKEEFMFFNGNKVQSFTEGLGVKVYAEELDGIYYLHSPDPVGDIDGTQFLEKENMTKIISFPIVQGSEWKAGGKEYKISNANLDVATKYGLVSGAIEITEKSGSNKRYIYYHEDIGLLKIKKYRKMLPSKTELELVKIQDKAALEKEKEEKTKEKEKKE